MKAKEERFSFSLHSLERGLERMLGIEPPYHQKQYTNIKILIVKNMQWHELQCRWVLYDFGLELVVKNNKVVSIVPCYKAVSGIKPVSEYMKKFSKRRKHQCNRRNVKSNKKGWEKDGKN